MKETIYDTHVQFYLDFVDRSLADKSGTGVRGHMGAYHRTLSTLINDLHASGFVLERLDEPVVGAKGLFSLVPQTLLVAARAE